MVHPLATNKVCPPLGFMVHHLATNTSKGQALSWPTPRGKLYTLLVMTADSPVTSKKRAKVTQTGIKQAKTDQALPPLVMTWVMSTHRGVVTLVSPTTAEQCVVSMCRRGVKRRRRHHHHRAVHLPHPHGWRSCTRPCWASQHAAWSWHRSGRRRAACAAQRVPDRCTCDNARVEGLLLKCNGHTTSVKPLTRDPKQGWQLAWKPTTSTVLLLLLCGCWKWWESCWMKYCRVFM